MKTKEVTAVHVACMVELKEVLKKYGGDMTAEEILALCSQLVGNVLALQDQTKWTASMLMKIIARNIEVGNAVAIASIMGEPQGEA